MVLPSSSEYICTLNRLDIIFLVIMQRHTGTHIILCNHIYGDPYIHPYSPLKQWSYYYGGVLSESTLLCLICTVGLLWFLYI